MRKSLKENNMFEKSTNTAMVFISVVSSILILRKVINYIVKKNIVDLDEK